MMQILAKRKRSRKSNMNRTSKGIVATQRGVVKSVISCQVHEKVHEKRSTYNIVVKRLNADEAQAVASGVE